MVAAICAKFELSCARSGLLPCIFCHTCHPDEPCLLLHAACNWDPFAAVEEHNCIELTDEMLEQAEFKDLIIWIETEAATIPKKIKGKKKGWDCELDTVHWPSFVKSPRDWRLKNVGR